jgi:geranylgeranyl diphosphate synthase type II
MWKNCLTNSSTFSDKKLLYIVVLQIVRLYMLSINELSHLYGEKFSVRDFDRQPLGLYRPMGHIMSIPGKRIRPLLLLLSCDAFGGDTAQALSAAHAMELFHNFTLVHDDIMDAATLRRGIPTVHHEFGLNAGILSGDALFIYAYHHLCQVGIHSLAAVLDVFNKTAMEIMEGQQMDMDFEQRLDVTIEEYLQMIGYKTSALLACSLQIGAILGGAGADDQARIYDFGMKLGLSFQIKDDWLDTFGESNKVGKKAGGDIIQNKKTYLLISLLDTIDGADKKDMLSLLDEKDELKKVDGIKALYRKYHISDKTSEKSDTLYKEAIASLALVKIPEGRKVNLSSMAEMIHNREF